MKFSKGGEIMFVILDIKGWFYISGHTGSIIRDLHYSILDTDDCVVEEYTGAEILEIAKKIKIINFLAIGKWPEYFIMDLQDHMFLDGKLRFLDIVRDTKYADIYTYSLGLRFCNKPKVDIFYGSTGILVNDRRKNRIAYIASEWVIIRVYVKFIMFKYDYYFLQMVVDSSTAQYVLYLVFDRKFNLSFVIANEDHSFGIKEDYVMPKAFKAKYVLVDSGVKVI